MIKTAHGYEDPSIRQIAIFLHNRVGELGEVLRYLGQEAIVVHAISVADSVDFAVMRMVVNHVDMAKETFESRGYSVTESPVLAVELPDAVDALLQVCRALLGAELNIHYAYPMFTGLGQREVVLIHVDDHVLASEVLRKRGLNLIDQHDLAGEGGGKDQAESGE